jgi:putative N6-adenine-specific DNA methylase/tRNA (guanine6-N2)-methyltransferase
MFCWRRSEGMAMAVLLTTNPGLEPFVASEVREKSGASAILRPHGFDGHVLAEALEPQQCLGLRSVHHVLLPLTRTTVRTLQDILEALEALPRKAIARGARFRVSCHRSGDHGFSSQDVQRETGAVLQKRYGLWVDLEQYELEVRIDIRGDRCSVALQRTRTPLSSRHKLRYAPMAALRANIAYAMLRLASPGRSLLDPFCGSGTILLEAAEVFPGVALYGCDVNEEAVAGARKNAEAEGHDPDIRHVDARALSRSYSPGFEAVVTNPPYGLRVGRHLDYSRFYRHFLRQARAILAPEGRMVLIAFKRREFRRELDRSPFLPAEEHAVEIGDITPKIYLLRREG